MRVLKLELLQLPQGLLTLKLVLLLVNNLTRSLYKLLSSVIRTQDKLIAQALTPSSKLTFELHYLLFHLILLHQPRLQILNLNLPCFKLLLVMIPLLLLYTL
uniref:Rho-GAP domain-containing protein n=1 Tax=Strombidium rassoulzadegani TaxID=1082188 RepID=A0A7S3CIP2_9SPIT|mmetsp:Transcript_11121/g.18659  ORF Transcript_11121/g.18659 Transcript_11121/m.18659 type:complete len:102 (+) Transcript_11121:305-610(+)